MEPISSSPESQKPDDHLLKRASKVMLGGKCIRGSYVKVRSRPVPAIQISRRQSLAVYSITVSARNRIEFGIFTLSALAVFMLITNSNFVGCSIGMSPGFVPLNIFSTK